MTTKINTAQPSLSNVASKVFSANPYAKFREFRNLDASITVYWGDTSGVTASTGYPLLPGEVHTWDCAVAPGDIYFIAASGTPKIATVEY
jgi:hypothetical protein